MERAARFIAEAEALEEAVTERRADLDGAA
jgi:hypothetical protein